MREYVCVCGWCICLSCPCVCVCVWLRCVCVFLCEREYVCLCEFVRRFERVCLWFVCSYKTLSIRRATNDQKNCFWVPIFWNTLFNTIQKVARTYNTWETLFTMLSLKDIYWCKLCLIHKNDNIFIKIIPKTYDNPVIKM